MKMTLKALYSQLTAVEALSVVQRYSYLNARGVRILRWLRLRSQREKK